MGFFTISLISGYSLIVLMNIIFNFSWLTVLNIFLCVVIIMLPAAVFLFVGRVLPKKWFDSKRLLFRVNKFQAWFCEFVRVKDWKDKIPVGGHVAGFRMNKLANPKDLDLTFLNRYIYESCFAEWLHTTCAVWGLLALIPIYFINASWVLPIALPIAVVFVYQNMVSTIIQWFVRPRIVKLRDGLIKRNKLSQNTEEKEEIKEEK